VPDLAVAVSASTTVWYCWATAMDVPAAGGDRSRTNPWSVAVGDFNGDGIADVAIANYGSNNVSVLLGNGDGTFRAAPTLAAGTNPWFVAVGDFNGDRVPDLAVANFGSDNVSILLGNGDGTFRPATTVAAGGSPAPWPSATSIAMG